MNKTRFSLLSLICILLAASAFDNERFVQKFTKREVYRVKPSE
ncbi:hypothetical protein JOD45_001179 [Scopulibacillus daqui]|uniref:Cyclic lactone autoinducer peptide n=1 Tax=Scopulibacillus daqui TaxID=1469162 RepID=A0ABS2PZH9_9BACL|nr:hypothetical protein [Scopulibacillus daqui]